MWDNLFRSQAEDMSVTRAQQLNRIHTNDNQRKHKRKVQGLNQNMHPFLSLVHRLPLELSISFLITMSDTLNSAMRIEYGHLTIYLGSEKDALFSKWVDLTLRHISVLEIEWHSCLKYLFSSETYMQVWATQWPIDIWITKPLYGELPLHTNMHLC